VSRPENHAAEPVRTRSYTGAMRTMHWATVALLLGGYSAVWAIGTAANAAEEAWLSMLHRSFGVTILALTVLRLAWRQRSPIPSLPADVPALQRFAARATAMALYGLLAAQPLLGLAGSMLHGDRIIVFGNFVIPAFLPLDPKLGRAVFEIHGWTALLLLALVGMHVSAALHHHFIRRDDVLAGMAPGLRPLGTPAPELARVPL